MKLSIILVNYNVRYFLEQALKSIYSSDFNHSFEIFVVDNASSDNSISMLHERFPDVNIIENRENVGFSRANNQAIKASVGKYVLLLNPDTILREDSLQKSVDYMDEQEKCGGLGIKMIDGRGNFLAESKRGLPTPLAAFFRMSGISSLFPHSKFFNAYHQGHLSEDENHKVDILAGAYMMLRRSVLDEIGLLDEDFFMYGEDIDISYRITKAGYYNYYLADSEIIHFKGESTRKASFNYVKTFHKAMIQFAQKHFNNIGGLYVFFLRLGIYFKATTSLFNRLIDKFGLLFIDFIILWAIGLLFKEGWESFYFGVEDFYTSIFSFVILPSVALVLLIITYLFGGYDRPFRFRKLLRGLVVGVLGVLAFYGLLGEELRSSRVVVSATALSSLGILPLLRSIRNLWKHNQFRTEYKPSLRYIIVGSKNRVEPVQQLLQKHSQSHEYIGRIDKRSDAPDTLGKIEDIESIVHAHRINEIFFCTSDISRKDIMQSMAKLGSDARYRIVEDSGFHILGSDSKNFQGELYTRRLKYRIDNPENRRAKRLFDIISALIFILIFPFTFYLFDRSLNFFNNAMNVLLGKCTWIGYHDFSSSLPTLKPGIITTGKVYENTLVSEATDQLYARDYSVWVDITTVYKYYTALDQ